MCGNKPKNSTHLLLATCDGSDLFGLKYLWEWRSGIFTKLLGGDEKDGHDLQVMKAPARGKPRAGGFSSVAVAVVTPFVRWSASSVAAAVVVDVGGGGVVVVVVLLLLLVVVVVVVGFPVRFVGFARRVAPTVW